MKFAGRAAAEGCRRTWSIARGGIYISDDFITVVIWVVAAFIYAYAFYGEFVFSWIWIYNFSPNHRRIGYLCEGVMRNDYSSTLQKTDIICLISFSEHNFTFLC